MWDTKRLKGLPQPFEQLQIKSLDLEIWCEIDSFPLNPRSTTIRAFRTTIIYMVDI